jgi:predicted transposase YdaD
VDFNRFDVSAKELVWDDPAAWLERLGIVPLGPVEVIDCDITTLTASADKVLKVADPDPYLVNLELNSYHDAGLARTLWFRQVALDYRHDLPVLTVLVLLCKEANSPNLTGTYDRHTPAGRLTNRYNYDVVRLWREDVEPFLTSGVGLVPLAPLTDVSEAAMPGVIRRMADRINHEPRPRAAKLWTATFLLMGLRFSDELAILFLEGVQTMHESTTYRRIINDGRLEEARRLLILQGEIRFGGPDESTRSAIEAIRDIERLERMSKRILDPDVQDWERLQVEP